MPEIRTGRIDRRPATRSPWLWGLGLVTALSLGASAWAESPLAEIPSSETAALPATGAPTATLEQSRDARLPEVLSERDVELYQKIFTAQEKGQWAVADKAIKELKDPLLMGHVLAQRLLHENHKVQPKEIKDWLAHYADHPDAKKIGELGGKRGKGKAPYFAQSGHDGTAFTGAYNGMGELGRGQQRAKAEGLASKARNLIRKGNVKAAKTLLESKEAGHLPAGELDRLRADFGTLLYGRNLDDQALEWAGKAAARSGHLIPDAHWTSGLAAYRLGRYAEAAKHFEKVGVHKHGSPWARSGGAFWAARAHLKAGEPAEVNRWLIEAINHPRTFYGLLAKRWLGDAMGLDWRPPPLGDQDLSKLTGVPAAKRALALVQVGLDNVAERELRGLYARLPAEMGRPILAVALRANMPGLAMRLGTALAREGFGPFDVTAYPLPAWMPEEGYRIDRALIYAIIRQESGFNPKAESRAGAKGLMQVMPRTAAFVAGDSSLRNKKNKALFDPSRNVAVGQDYAEMLLNDNLVGGNLFFLAAAWNGGPGNTSKWLRSVKHDDDPLLFIESIPARETRNFIERVLANLWIYRDRMGQPIPSLDALAAGDWPLYMSLDQGTEMVASHVEDRR